MTPNLPRTGYLALDEVLERPRIRILRALLRFDWASADEIRVALDEPDAELVSWTLRNMRRCGEIERKGPIMESVYRITRTGARNLKAMMRRTRP